MKVIGITGGVGAGKSTILSHIEKNYNARIIMTDDVAKQLEEKGESCYKEIVREFGENILSDKGDIDKNRLAQLIFSNKENLKKINSIVHPAVKAYIINQIESEKNKYDYLIIESALLIEDNYGEICDEMWYIYTSCDKRRERLKESRGYSDEKIDSIFKNQLTEEIFRKNCHKVIDNDASKTEALRQVDEALEGRNNR